MSEHDQLDAIATMRERHNVIEWEIIDLFRALYDGPWSPLQSLRLLDLLGEHNALELRILQAYARLPKAVADRLRAEEGECERDHTDTHDMLPAEDN